MTQKKDNPEKSGSDQKKKDTDPQEHMKGPVSSFVQGVKKEVEKDDKETKEEADKKKDKNI
ncbi:MAG: hypothetical protein ABI480_02500 [Chitinophagaceae bacterium]